MCVQVTGIHASTNNQASTVFTLFLKAIEVYGTPSRVWGDHGGENLKVAVWMTMHRGGGRGSFLWGTSVYLLLSKL